MRREVCIRSTYRIRYVFRPRLIKEGPATYGILPRAPQRHRLADIRIHVPGHVEKDWLGAGVDELRAIARGSRNAEIENMYGGEAYQTNCAKCNKARNLRWPKMNLLIHHVSYWYHIFDNYFNGRPTYTVGYFEFQKWRQIKDMSEYSLMWKKKKKTIDTLGYSKRWMLKDVANIMPIKWKYLWYYIKYAEVIRFTRSCNLCQLCHVCFIKKHLWGYNFPQNIGRIYLFYIVSTFE